MFVCRFYLIFGFELLLLVFIVHVISFFGCQQTMDETQQSEREKERESESGKNNRWPKFIAFMFIFFIVMNCSLLIRLRLILSRTFPNKSTRLVRNSVSKCFHDITCFYIQPYTRTQAHKHGKRSRTVPATENKRLKKHKN